MAERDDQQRVFIEQRVRPVVADAERRAAANGHAMQRWTYVEEQGMPGVTNACAQCGMDLTTNFQAMAQTDALAAEHQPALRWHCPAAPASGGPDSAEQRELDASLAAVAARVKEKGHDLGGWRFEATGARGSLRATCTWCGAPCTLSLSSPAMIPSLGNTAMALEWPCTRQFN